jgi:hypothetical protein
VENISYCFDLDDTMLDKLALMREPLNRVVKVSRRTPAECALALKRAGEVTFTFPTWFADLGIDPSLWRSLERGLRAIMKQRASACVYAGMREILLRLKAKDKVLITAGEVRFQQWKFNQTQLSPFFLPKNRHFIRLEDSKANAIRPYVLRGRVKFVEDKPSRLAEVLDVFPEVECIRPRWPGSSSFVEHPDDGGRWAVADTMDELERHLFSSPTPR